VVGYLRTSSPTNVGEDKDSEPRQRAAIEAGAKRLGLKVVDWFYDAGISGDVPVSDRPGFTAMLDRIDGNGVRTVVVESADRFARKLLTAELGILLLSTRGVTLIDKNGENLTDTDDEMRVAFRQMAMAFAQLEKTRLVKKLKLARDRASQKAGRRIEGRPGYAALQPGFIAFARARRREGMTLQAIAEQMAARGARNGKGRPFAPAQIARMLKT